MKITKNLFTDIKNIALSLLTLAVFTGCVGLVDRPLPPVQKVQIGHTNMISIRNIDVNNFKYELLAKYAGGSDKELRQSRSETINEAVEQTVRRVQGGEFLVNAKIYLVQNLYYVVEGDVWGIKSDTNYRGFKVGDRVIWDEKDVGLFSATVSRKDGVIKSLKDDKTCLIQQKNGVIVEKNYDEITKID
ncbi:MAG: hypothetical protein LBB59_06295 [Campylobacteraceae bacterium]|jgi:hypothetical protein|nr:hypothetical protein [Campylobacteraceae bacterium]